MKNENKLLVRVYNVGFGDCIYIRVPDKFHDGETGETKLEHRHILIDCGTIKNPSNLSESLKYALDDVKKMLPEINGNKYFDLLVVTHPHRDHMSGFKPESFEDVIAKHIWLSVIMDESHPQGPGARALEEIALKSAVSLQMRGLQLGGVLLEMLQYKSDNESNLKMLRETLSKKSEPKEPLYVCRDVADPSKHRLTDKKKKEYKVEFSEGTTNYQGFYENETKLRVLAPEWDIDGEYLREKSTHYLSLANQFAGDYDYRRAMAYYEDPLSDVEDNSGAERIKPPEGLNISNTDFNNLLSSLYDSALLFTGEEHALMNNVSVVLLLEWRGKRLLFTGDSEWLKGGYSEVGHNFGWNVMVERDKSKHLKTSVDFLKLSHHGSGNGTPYDVDAKELQNPIPELLPKEKKKETKIVVSVTKHGSYKRVPENKLLSSLRKHGTVLRTNASSHLASNKNYIEVTFEE